MEASKNSVRDEEIGEKMDVEAILLKSLGHFGRFQIRIMLLCAIVAIFNAWSSSEYLFTTARITTRCLVPECDSNSPEFNPPWLYNAIPSENEVLDNCQRFVGNSSTGVTADMEEACPAQLFDWSTTKSCQEYVYENTNTIVYDYDLGCNEWMRTIIGSIRIMGVLIAMPIIGYISDRWGRRKTLIIICINSAWLGVTRYWADTYAGFLTSEVVEGMTNSGAFTTAYILMIEVTHPKYRPLTSVAMTSFFAVGQMTLGLIAWGVPYWRNLTLAVYIPQFLSISYIWIATESVRWYMSKGKYVQAEEVLQKIARVNKETLAPETLIALRQCAENQERQQTQKKQENIKEPWLIVLVFRHKKVFLRCVVAPVWWITNTFVYYGLSVNAVNMTGNRHLNFVLVSAVEIPGFWSAVLLIDRVGRKPSLAGAFWVCAACQMVYIFISTDNYGLTLSLFLLGKFSIAIAATTMYIYTAELYPTKHRHSLFAFTSMVGRIGAIIAPLTPAFAAATFEEFPFVLFGSLALISGLLLFFTPETMGTKLPDTMEQAENLEKKEAIPTS